MARIRGGNGTIGMDIDGNLEQYLRQVLRGASGGLAGEVEKIIDKVKIDAKAVWYDEVDRETGKSQDSIKSEIIITPTQIIGKVYATEKRTYMMMRPGPFSRIRKRPVNSDQEYWSLVAHWRLRGALPPNFTYKEIENGRPVGIFETILNPKASDGKNMWRLHVVQPGVKMAKQAVRELSAAAARGAGGS